jgi:predicted hydrocarbon binding protein
MEPLNKAEIKTGTRKFIILYFLTILSTILVLTFAFSSPLMAGEQENKDSDSIKKAKEAINAALVVINTNWDSLERIEPVLINKLEINARIVEINNGITELYKEANTLIGTEFANSLTNLLNSNLAAIQAVREGKINMESDASELTELKRKLKDCMEDKSNLEVKVKVLERAL